MPDTSTHPTTETSTNMVPLDVACNGDYHPGHRHCERYHEVISAVNEMEHQSFFMLQIMNATKADETWETYKREYSLVPDTPRPSLDAEALEDLPGIISRIQSFRSRVYQHCRVQQASDHLCRSRAAGGQICGNPPAFGEAYCPSHFDEVYKCTMCEPLFVKTSDGVEHQLPRAYICDEHSNRCDESIEKVQEAADRMDAVFQRVFTFLRPYTHMMGVQPGKWDDKARVVIELITTPVAKEQLPDTVENLCPICFTDFFPSAPLTDEAGAPVKPEVVAKVKGCKHHFHASCLNSWFESGEANEASCPSCRAKVTGEGFKGYE